MKKSLEAKKDDGRKTVSDSSRKIGSLIFGLFEFALLPVSCIGGIPADGAKQNAKRKGKAKSSARNCAKNSDVPTEDRIAIPKRVVKECRKEAASSDAGLTGKEKSEILRLRRAGLPIKEIAKRVHRRDRTVSSFLSER